MFRFSFTRHWNERSDYQENCEDNDDPKMSDRKPPNFDDDIPHKWDPWFDDFSDFGNFDDDEEFFNPKPSSTKPKAQKPVHWCIICYQPFETMADLESHLCRLSQQYFCPQCDDGKDYLSEHQLRRHWQAVHGQRYCKHCAEHFATVDAKGHHMEARHAYCEPCGRYFDTPEQRRLHWANSAAHRTTYCSRCDFDLPDAEAFRRHCAANHRLRPYRTWRPEPSSTPGPADNRGRPRAEPGHPWNDWQWRYSDEPGSGADEEPNERYRSERDQQRSGGTPQEEVVPDHYATLGVRTDSSQAEIIRASKKRRIETHPDRLKRAAGLSPADLAKIDAVAARVGWAADILCDAEARSKYDSKMRGL